MTYTIEGSHRDLGDRLRARGARPGHQPRPSCSAVPPPPTARAPNTPGLAGRRRHARHAAGGERLVRRAGGADRARACKARDQPQSRCSSGRTISTPTCPAATRSASTSTRSSARGKLTIDFPDGTAKDIGITRLHLEMDAGKSLHESHADASLIDLNRSGVALMEIVSEPDIRTPEEAVLYLRKLRSILRYLGTCDGNMEEGSLRCDANVSVRRVGDDDARHALRGQERQLDALRRPGDRVRGQAPGRDPGGAAARIDQETRLFDSARGETRSMRSKEEAHDYRYFPDPDLLPLELEEALVERIAAEPARAARRQEGPLRARLRPVALRRRRAGGRGRDGRLFRDGGPRPRRQAGRELGQSTTCSACSARPARASRTARSRRRAWASSSTCSSPR